MSNLISKEELKEIKKFLNSVDLDAYNFDFDEIDFQQVSLAIKASSLYTYLPSANEDTISSIKVNKDGNFYFDMNGKNSVTTTGLAPMIELAANTTKNGTIIDEKWLDKIYGLIEAFIKNTLSLNQQSKKVKKEILNRIKDIDSTYLELRKRIMSIEGQYSDDLFEYLMLLPDLLVYLIKLVASDKVPSLFKIRLVGAIIYVLAPVDVIPEAILGPLGFIDDVYLSLRFIIDLLLISDVSKEMLVELWPGKISSINNIKELYADVKRLLNGPLLALIDVFYNKIMNKTKNDS